MRIAILSQYYPPELGAPQNRLSDLAGRLTDRGHSIEVLTALPNYPENRVFPAYRTASVVREVLDGVPTKRLSLYVPSRKTPVRRIAHYCSFALHALLRGPGLLSEADYVITESPPLFLAPVGAYPAWKLKAQFVMNVSDLWPASVIGLGALRPGRLERAAVRLEEWCYRQAALITGQSNGIIEDIAARFPWKTVHLYPNVVDLGLWKGTPSRAAARKALGWSEQSFIVGYVGLHSHAQALEQVILAAQRLRDRPRIQIALFVDGPEKESLQARAKQLDLANVLFYAPEPHGRVPSILSAIDVGIVPLADRKVFEGVRPSKIFEIMASSRPVLLAGRGEPARLVEESGGGIVTPPENPQELELVIRELAADPERRKAMGENGRRYVEREFDREKIATEVEDFLYQHLRRSPLSPS